MVQPVAVEQHGATGAERHAEHPSMAPPQYAERPLEIALTRQRLEGVLGEDGDGH